MDTIKTPRDFVSNAENILILDGINMRLQVIGEHSKKIEKLKANFFTDTLKIDPDPIIRFRDFISHHYEKTDYEIIFDICSTHIPELRKIILDYLNSVQKK
jgi:uncharacterized protein with HEPN domain